MGSRFQAEIPLMRDRALAAADPHKADLVWQPWENLESSREKQRQGERGQASHGWRSPAPSQPSPALKALFSPPSAVEDLLTAACSSIFPGAGTNQELALHCLHESRGDILVRQRLGEGPSGRLAQIPVCCHRARPADLRQAGGSDQAGDGSGLA